VRARCEYRTPLPPVKHHLQVVPEALGESRELNPVGHGKHSAHTQRTKQCNATANS